MSNTENNQRLTILVVDDQADLILLLKTILEREGYRVVIAVDQVAAEEAWQDQKKRLMLF
jgi:CheY-like chemotaxis protein